MGGYSTQIKQRHDGRRMTRNGNLYRRPDVDRMTTTATFCPVGDKPGRHDS
ncbi:predicted protein [Streptomyces filamentosus NRRL 15998]|uniref:Predicted protein n=1 Tax=Streptomyces filamentosus NRRL 15998 TaxID=457431 RepID=D6AK68_STRFL|nr:predicted protein [Streptomyces filamentosus NRRL 15998]